MNLKRFSFFCTLNYHLILLSVIFLPQTWSIKVTCDPVNQTAIVNDIAELTCKMNTLEAEEVTRIVWTNKVDDIIYNYVPNRHHLGRNKREKSRFSVNDESFKNGQIMLRITDVMMSDGGVYYCTVITEEEFLTESVNLLVKDLAPPHEEDHDIADGPKRNDNIIIGVLVFGSMLVIVIALALYKYLKIKNEKAKHSSFIKVNNPFLLHLLKPSIHSPIAEPAHSV
ncbi:uncharacterized protein LOC114661882 [Erpetoichthys calabaricus]|uniref:uncharacterized protein LOC114661882 n=1 Tax=Erpetoichthys calabaricus TaxID=27687 RepID=UPI0010A0563E|nr:uncharacterized protein LOC114661882 [Erpetoichthys calabaricus]